MIDPQTELDVPKLLPHEPAPQPPTSPPPQGTELKIDDSGSAVAYANFCRLLGTPEELIIDFGLNTQVLENRPHAVATPQRVVTGWYTAKRLLRVLQQTVERHEAVFGVLETDAGKRARRGAGR